MLIYSQPSFPILLHTFFLPFPNILFHFATKTNILEISHVGEYILVIPPFSTNFTNILFTLSLPRYLIDISTDLYNHSSPPILSHYSRSTPRGTPPPFA